MFGRGSKIRKVAPAAVSLALFLVIGGPWAVLQTVAWTKMIVDYSQGTTLGEAVAKTFDGEHPCALCKKISKAKTERPMAPGTASFMPKDFSFLAVQRVSLMVPEGSQFNHFLRAYPAMAGPIDDLPTPVPIS